MQDVNQLLPDYYDGQVTVCFYAGLHLVNAHLDTYGLQYRKHKDVKDILNPYTISPAKLPEGEYHAYVTLQSLSRRARYLVNEKDNNLQKETAFFTYEKHLAKSLHHLNTLISFFNNRYSLGIKPVKVNCIELKYKETPFILKP